MSEFMIVYNIISHIPQNQNLGKSAKVRVADSYADEQTAKNALFELMLDDFDAAQRDSTDLINKRSFSLQKMAVRLAPISKPEKATATDGGDPFNLKPLLNSIMPLVKPEPSPKKETQYNKYLDNLIYNELGLSVRARNCLRSDNCVTVRDVTLRTEEELKMIPYLGKTTYKEIVEWLNGMGLKHLVDA